jgi:hypothetical protein
MRDAVGAEPLPTVPRAPLPVGPVPLGGRCWCPCSTASSFASRSATPSTMAAPSSAMSTATAWGVRGMITAGSHWSLTSTPSWIESGAPALCSIIVHGVHSNYFHIWRRTFTTTFTSSQLVCGSRRAPLPDPPYVFPPCQRSAALTFAVQPSPLSQFSTSADLGFNFRSLYLQRIYWSSCRQNQTEPGLNQLRPSPV